MRKFIDMSHTSIQNHRIWDGISHGVKVLFDISFVDHSLSEFTLFGLDLAHFAVAIRVHALKRLLAASIPLDNVNCLDFCLGLCQYVWFYHHEYFILC